MVVKQPFYAHQDDNSDLTDDALAAKVWRFILQSDLPDTGSISLIAIGSTVMINGEVAVREDIGRFSQAVSSVIGVKRVINGLRLRVEQVPEGDG